MPATTTVQLRDPSGSRLREAMAAAGKSTRTLAEPAGVSSTRIHQLSQGQDPGCALPVATAIVAALDVPIGDLFYFPDGPALIRLGLIDVP